jgi:hypothetical protein
MQPSRLHRHPKAETGQVLEAGAVLAMKRRKRARAGETINGSIDRDDESIGHGRETDGPRRPLLWHRRVTRTGSSSKQRAGMENPRHIDGEEWRMPNVNPRKAGATSGKPVPGEARREPEPTRAEMPEWLAKELFKIFV